MNITSVNNSMMFQKIATKQFISQAENEVKNFTKTSKRFSQAELIKATEMLLEDLNCGPIPSKDNIIKKITTSEAVENYKITSQKLAEQKK